MLLIFAQVLSAGGKRCLLQVEISSQELTNEWVQYELTVRQTKLDADPVSQPPSLSMEGSNSPQSEEFGLAFRSGGRPGLGLAGVAQLHGA